MRRRWTCNPNIEHVNRCLKGAGWNDECGCGCDTMATCVVWAQYVAETQEVEEEKTVRRRNRRRDRGAPF